MRHAQMCSRKHDEHVAPARDVFPFAALARNLAAFLRVDSPINCVSLTSSCCVLGTRFRMIHQSSVRQPKFGIDATETDIFVVLGSGTDWATAYVPRVQDFPGDYVVDETFDSDSPDGRPGAYVIASEPSVSGHTGVVTSWTDEEKEAARVLLRHSQEALRESGKGVDVMGSGGEVDAMLNELSPQLQASIRRVDDGCSEAIERFRREAVRMGVETTDVRAKPTYASVNVRRDSIARATASSPPPGVKPLGLERLTLTNLPAEQSEVSHKSDSVAEVQRGMVTRIAHARKQRFDTSNEVYVMGSACKAWVEIPDGLPSTSPATTRVLLATVATLGIVVAAVVAGTRVPLSWRIDAVRSWREAQHANVADKPATSAIERRHEENLGICNAQRSPQLLATITGALLRRASAWRLAAYGTVLVCIKLVLPWAYRAPLHQAAFATAVAYSAWCVANEFYAVSSGNAFALSFPSLKQHVLLADAAASFDISRARLEKDVASDSPRADMARSVGRMYVTDGALALYGFFAGPCASVALADIVYLETLPGGGGQDGMAVRMTLGESAAGGSLLVECHGSKGISALRALIRAVEKCR